MHKLNPNLDMEISISGEIPSIDSSDFNSRIVAGLSTISPSITSHPGDIYKFPKNFSSFDGNITISPNTPQNGRYHFLFIKVKTSNIKLKKVRECLGEIQMYLFRDVVGAMNQSLRFEADRNNEGISVTLENLPTIFRSTAGLNIDDITASEEGIRITFSKDNININGSIEPRTIEKIENIIRSNLTA